VPVTRSAPLGRASLASAAVVAAAALAVPACAVAQAPPAVGTAAGIDAAIGGDHTLGIWRDAATGETALLDSRAAAGDTTTFLRGTALVQVQPAERGYPASVHTDRYSLPGALDDALRWRYDVTLADIDAALAAGAPAPEPAAVSRSRAAEPAVPAHRRTVTLHFGAAARTLAARAPGRVAWAGPRRLGATVRETSFGPDGAFGRGAYSVVRYGRGPVAFARLCDDCFTISSAPAGSAGARRLLLGRRLTERFAGRPATDARPRVGITVRVGGLIATIHGSDLTDSEYRRIVQALRAIPE
jgi:hypothetical protein